MFHFRFSAAVFLDRMDQTCLSDASTDCKRDDKEMHLVIFDCCKATP